MLTPKKRLTLRENNKLEGQYANYFKVGHNAYEFVIDFGQYYPGTEEAELYTRIITSPVYVMEFLNILKDALNQFERKHGKIQRL